MCCSESNPAWLLVSLGAVRPLATLQFVHDQDLSYTLSLSNSSDGPFVEVARRACEFCVMNQNSPPGVPYGVRVYREPTYQLHPAAAAAFVRLTITWSSGGGVGGCDDLCDWASDVYEFRAFGPGLLPGVQIAAPPPSLPPPARACPRDDDAGLVQSRTDMEASIGLLGDAESQPEGSGVRGAGAVVLTPPEPRRFGAAEYARIIRPAESCTCGSATDVLITMYVWLGGSASMPGEGLVISLVDAQRQTPGNTVFKRGCGTRPALPESSMSIVLDTSDSDPSCDEPGTSIRMVASLEGGNAPPFVMSSSLDMSSTAFRRGTWLPVQIAFTDYGFFNMARSGNPLERHGQYAVRSVWINGTETLSPGVLLTSYEPRMRAANVTLQRFYIVVSARTGSSGGLAPSDRHAVSGVRVECTNGISRVENWAGLRQPYAPPRSAPPWKAPPPQLAASSQRAAFLVRRRALLGAVSFGIAFACTLALLLGTVVLPLRRRADTPKELAAVITHESDKLVALPPTPPAQHMWTAFETEVEFHVFLSYRRSDARLVDSIYDKLRLSGLRVFKDVNGSLAGKPFDAELIRAMRAAPVFAPLITLASIQQLGAAATQPDVFLAELLVAMWLRDEGDTLIHPMLVGAETEAGWASLFDEPCYDATLAALPDVASAATVALVDSALRRSSSGPLPPHIAALTVREVLLGRAAAPAVVGVLSSAPFTLACALPDLDLYIRRQYMPPIKEAARRLSIERAARRQSTDSERPETPHA